MGEDGFIIDLLTIFSSKNMLRTIDANTQERKDSEFARYGARYYPVDPSYDKRVYENSAFNYVKIVGCLILFWIMNALHWWGVFALGIVNANALAWYSIGCWFFTVFFLGGLLCAGRQSNKLKRQHEFYVEKIAENRAIMQEKETKALQEEIHAKKLEEHQKKLAEINAAAQAQENGTTEDAPAPAPSMFQQIVTHIQDAVQPAADNRLIQPDTRQ